MEMPPPRAISIPIISPAIRTRSFVFPQNDGDRPDFRGDCPDFRAAKMGLSPSSLTAQKTGHSPLTLKPTRIKPPGDVIKLEDRLNYLLQPSLESLLVERALTFPFRPFPYQFEGAAFLFPRHAAILADEMGLGKTMQAITAVRLLLHRGEVRRVLLICPKPLVSNWQREFQQWRLKYRSWRSKAINPSGLGNGTCPACRSASPIMKLSCAIGNYLKVPSPISIS